MKRIHFFRIRLKLVINIIIYSFIFTLTLAQPVPALYTTSLPFPMPEIKLPDFPDRTISIIDYGAVGDGRTLNTKAFMDAIQTCAKAGGGKVVVPAGIWLTGPIKLESNINLHIERGALVLFSKQLKDYPVVPRPTPFSKNLGYMTPIYGYNLENVAITGPGIIDGSGEIWRPMKKEKYTAEEWKDIINSGGVVNGMGNIWWPSVEAMNASEYFRILNENKKPITEKDVVNTREYLRPNMVEFYGCKKVLLDGPTFQNSPKFILYPTQCENLVIRNITVRNSWNAQNGDGIDINACHNVVIYNCTVDVGDDGICLKLGKPEKSRGWEVACENIVIADCVVYRAHGGFVIGSNTDGGARNISVRNCIFNGTDIGLRFKSGRGRGGLVENISIDGIVMNNIVNDAILFDLYYINTGVGTDPGISIKKPEVPSSEKNMPIFQKFFMKNIVCQGAERAVFINSLPEKCIKEIDFKDITISAKKGVSCTNGENLHFTNVSIMANHSPIYEFNECRNITIDHSIYTEGTEVFLKAEGKQSENIQIIKTDISKAKKGIELSGDAKPDAVIQR